ncbi:hypothetical protein ACJZ2D_009382 [Fusarium nematophilum]
MQARLKVVLTLFHRAEASGVRDQPPAISTRLAVQPTEPGQYTVIMYLIRLWKAKSMHAFISPLRTPAESPSRHLLGLSPVAQGLEITSLFKGLPFAFNQAGNAFIIIKMSNTSSASNLNPGLPSDFDPDSLTLREATEAEKIQSWGNNSASWKGRLTVEQYIEQQALNGRQALTRNGRIRYWILTDGVEIYTSAETLQKPVVVCGQNGEQSHVWTYGVAGVFTPARFRNHGCASTLMRKLVEWLDADAAVCDFTVLWSAVGVSVHALNPLLLNTHHGQNFYERFGWMVFDTKEALIPAAPSLDTGKTVPLSRDRVKELCHKDVETITTQLAQTAQDKATVVCLPTYAQAEWYFESEEYIASQLFASPSRTPKVKGATSMTENAWCYWLHDFNADKLIILRLSINEGGDLSTSLAHLVQAARDEAHRWGLQQVSIWDPDPRVLEASEKVLGACPKVLAEIENNIPCLRWKGGKWGDELVEKVSWQHREMYPWC